MKMERQGCIGNRFDMYEYAGLLLLLATYADLPQNLVSAACMRSHHQLPGIGICNTVQLTG